MPEEENKMYALICKERFDRIEETINNNHKEVITVLKGKNGDAGLCEKVRKLESRWIAIFGSLGVIFATLITQFVRWLFEVF